jgi:hypothetical protein
MANSATAKVVKRVKVMLVPGVDAAVMPGAPANAETRTLSVSDSGTGGGADQRARTHIVMPALVAGVHVL